MPSLCDVNVLVALAYRKHAFHQAAAAWLSEIENAAAVMVCRQTQLGLLRLLSTRCDGRR